MKVEFSRLAKIGLGSGYRGVVTTIISLCFLALTASVSAQETTSSVRGIITSDGISPVAGATVTIVDTRTGATRRLTTTSNGNFTASGMKVGGPYRIDVNGAGVGQRSVSDVYLQLGTAYIFNAALTDQRMEEVITTAVAVQSEAVAIGPASTYGLDDLEGAPALSRDFTDLIKIDPRIYIDEADVDGVQCLGASSRFNSLTVDGIKLNDNFGLNRNGYPTERTPYPYDGIDQVSVELAPFDVEYGGFTACNINAVTKSGTNEYHGSFFYDFTSDSFIGDSLEGDDIDPGDFSNKRYGVSLGGPIIKDKLFFYLAYQHDDSSVAFDRCAGDASCGRPVEGVTQAQLDRIENIAQTIYGFEPGSLITNAPFDDDKLLIKFDWNINDVHRANISYNYNDGFTPNASDDDSDEFEFSNHYYDRGATLDAYSTNLFSNWSDVFSTELRVGYSKLDNSQQTRDDQVFGEFRIETYADIDGDGNFSRANVYLGNDDSRQSNKLDYETFNLKLSGEYSIDNHVISAGYERENLEVENLFLQHSVGEYRFDEMCDPGNPDGCIDALEALSPDDIYYGNAAGTNNPLDAAGALEYSINTLYVQDDWALMGGDLQLVFGLRYDWYTSDDLPTANPNFEARNGFTNATNFDGEGLLQPRFGFTWDYSDRLSLRGGIGLYSGGNPNVWLTNNYQVDGITQVQAREFNVGLSGLNVSADSLATIPLSGGGQPGFDIPQAFVDFVATGSANSSVNALDPDFEIPSNWKFALGATYDFNLGRLGNDYQLNADLLLTKGNNSAIVRDATLEQVDTAPDGRPIYRNIDRSDPDCAVPTSSDCGNRLFNSDFILGNVEGDDSKQTAISLALSKDYDFGLDWTLAYAYIKAEDVNPMTSSVAFSNFANVSVADSNNPGRAVSNYQIPQRFTLRVGYRTEFFDGYETRFTVFGSANEGRPFSYTFDNDDGDIFGDLIDGRHLLYMPTGPDDPLVNFDPGFDQDAFFAFAQSAGLNGFAGGIVPRNEFDSDWWTKFDVRIAQEVRGFRADDRGELFVLFRNFGNLLNDDWGVQKEVGFPRAESIVDAEYDAANNQYIFENFNVPAGQVRSTRASRWQVILGLQYKF